MYLFFNNSSLDVHIKKQSVLMHDIKNRVLFLRQICQISFNYLKCLDFFLKILYNMVLAFSQCAAVLVFQSEENFQGHFHIQNIPTKKGTPSKKIHK